MINFLGKTKVSTSIVITRDLIQKSIAGWNVLVEMETTQDISFENQWSIAARYAHEAILLERLLFLVKAEDASQEKLIWGIVI